MDKVFGFAPDSYPCQILIFIYLNWEREIKVDVEDKMVDLRLEGNGWVAFSPFA